MIIHQREIGYGEDYPVFFDALDKAKAYLEKKYPEISVELMYNLSGHRGRATIQTRYASLADYERIDAEVDNDEEYSKLLKSIMTEAAKPVVDQFFRLIQSHQPNLTLANNRREPANHIVSYRTMLPRKMPGVSKNAIDWLTRPPEDKSRIFGNLPVGLMGATLGSFGTARMVASIASIRSTGMVWETHVGKRRYELVR